MHFRSIVSREPSRGRDCTARSRHRRRRTRPHRVRPRARERRPDPRRGLSSLFTFDPTTREASPVLRRLDASRSAQNVFPVTDEIAPAAVFPSRDASRALARISTHGRRARARVIPCGTRTQTRVPLQRVSRVASSRRTRPGVDVPDARGSSAVDPTHVRLCPIEAVIERVVVSPSGVVMALWNVAGGAEPRAFRDALRRALPSAGETNRRGQLTSARRWRGCYARLQGRAVREGITARRRRNARRRR